MKTQRKVAAVCSAAIVLILLVAYTAGYFLMGHAWRPGPGPGPHKIRVRVFPSSRIAAIYQPAVWLESKLRGYEISAGDGEMHQASSP